MAPWVKFLAFSCPHCPHEDKQAIDWLKGRIRHHAPDYIIHLGDGHEASAASKFPNEERTTLKEEYVRHDHLLYDVRTTAEIAAEGKQVKCYFLPGNHDANIDAECRINEKVRSCCDYRLHEEELKEGRWTIPCEYVYDRIRGTFSIGAVTFAHGFECGVNSDEAQAILLSRYTNGLFVSGHTHRPVHVTRACRTRQIPLPYHYANVGCMRNLKPTFVERKRTHNWGQALIAGECQLINSPRTTKTWDAQVEIFRMGDE